MVSRMDDLVRSIRVGEPTEYENLSVVPLLKGRDSKLEYLVLDDAVEQNLVDVDEVDGGSVPRLVVRNRASLPVLIPDGTTLAGGRQNRVVNLSVLLAAESDTVIPVSCIERGRWSRSRGPSSPRGGYSDKKLRYQMCRDVNSSAGKGGGVSVSQSGVWCHVQELLEKAKAHSPSAAYHRVFEESKRSLEECEKRFPYPDGACGAAMLVDGKVSSVDVFDKPETCRKLWPKLVRGHAVGSLHATGKAGSHRDVGSFLGEAVQAREDEVDSIGIGTSVRLTAEHEVGAALLCDQTLVHLSLFADETPEAPGTREQQPPTQPPSRHRPWWKFWA